MVGFEQSPPSGPTPSPEATGSGPQSDAAQAPAPSWQRRLARSAPFRLAQSGYVTVLHRLFQWRSAPYQPVAAAAPGRYLVVAPHPDDETLGCAGVMRVLVSAGAAVTVAVVTDGRHSHRSNRITADELAAQRRRESIEACALLGVNDVRFLDFEERSLVAGEAALEARLASLIEDVAPCEVFLPSRRDGHIDHRVINTVARRVLARSGTERVVSEYPIWFWDAASWAQPGTAPWRKVLDVLTGPLRTLRHFDIVRVDMGAHRSVKNDAIAAYRSQTTSFTGEADWAVFDARFLDNFLRFDELFFRPRR